MARILLGPLSRALVVENPHMSLDALLEAEGISVHRKSGTSPGEDELIELLQQTKAQVIFKRSRVPVTRKVVESAPDLMAVQLCCIGDDSVDTQACADHGVMVFNDPVSNGRSVVEMAMGHLIALSRRFYETNELCRSGVWEKNNRERYEIRGKVLGILGLGNIGRAVARAAENFGMKIRFFDTREVAVEVGQEFGWHACETLEELFEGADYLTVHVSARTTEGGSNEGLISQELFEKLGSERPEGSPRIFLNLSRGFLYDSASLLGAVKSGAVRRAAVDVYPEEPFGQVPWVNPYGEEPRIVVTPHIGAATQEAQPRIAQRTSQTLGHFSGAGRVRDCVFGSKVRLALVDGTGAHKALLLVGHATARGTKRAIDDAIYEAGASNLASTHRDFVNLGFAYDLAALDRPLTPELIEGMVAAAAEVTGDDSAIRCVRQIIL
jgi:D-3-phosphoglycerate dehydrogenase